MKSQSMFRRLFGLAMLILAVALPAAADEGGITFPLVADFTDADGTTYVTTVTLYPIRDFPTPVYLHYQWLPVAGQGEAVDVMSPYNPIMGSDVLINSIVARYLSHMTGKNLGGLGALRLSPVDDAGHPLPNVRLSGFSRLDIVRKDGGHLSERSEGIPDERRPGVRAGNGANTVIYGPHRGEVRQVWIGNFGSQSRQFFAAATAQRWSWSTKITVAPNSMAVISLPAMPDEILDIKDRDGNAWDGPQHYAAYTVASLSGSGPFSVVTTSINGISGDIRELLDMDSDH